MTRDKCFVAFWTTFWAYKYDWLAALCAGIIGGLPQILVEPARQRWTLDNYTLQHAKTDSSVPNTLLFLIFILVPVAILLIAGSKLGARFAHHAVLGWFTQMCFTLFFQGTMSVVAGGLRPDWYERCDPDPTTPRGVQPICRSSDSSGMEDGRRSFPCGHCSFALGSGLFFAYFFVPFFDPFNGKGFVWKFVLLAAPPLGGILVGLTRWNDARHHPWDVVVGFLIGLTTATFAYFNFWNNPLGPLRGLPRCIRDTLGMPEKYITEELVAPVASPAPVALFGASPPSSNSSEDDGKRDTAV
eukprot:m.265844 g.265844  ORF g.265844 m.265844 type:complete len:300 (-) comp29640_c0_seq1:26-925(-)